MGSCLNIRHFRDKDTSENRRGCYFASLKFSAAAEKEQLCGFVAHFGFDELRRPANLALRVTLNVIYPAAPAQSGVHFLRPAAVVRDDDPPKAIKGGEKGVRAKY